MRQQLRKLRLQGLALVIAATGVACVAQPPTGQELGARQTVAMVRAGEFRKLNRYYSAVQASYDGGKMSDRRLLSAFRHFRDTAPDLAPRYASWVKEMPNSYVAHLARAIYYLRIGQQSRGDRFISDTSQKQLRDMDEAFTTSLEELQKSASLEKKPLLTVFYELDIGLYGGDAERNRQLLQASIAIQPDNFIVRDMYLGTLQTAWGGSTAQMKEFVASCKAAGLPAAQITELTSEVIADEAWVDDSDNNYKRAGLEYLEVNRLSPGGTSLLSAGSDFMQAGDFPDTVTALSDYLTSNPDSEEALYLRAFAYFALNRMTDGTHDCARAAALGNSYCQYWLGWSYSIGAYGVSMDKAAAIKWLTLAAKQGNKSAERLLPIVQSGQLWRLAQPQPHPH